MRTRAPSQEQPCPGEVVGCLPQAGVRPRERRHAVSAKSPRRRGPRELIHVRFDAEQCDCVVQAQLDAYNDQDIDALLRTYAADAEQFVLHGERLARGHNEMRPRFLMRFAEPDLRARLLSRVAVANVVVDSEVVTRNFPEGVGTLEMLRTHEVERNRIRKASFVVGEKRLHGIAGPGRGCLDAAPS